jgi:peroxin-14
LTWPSDKLRTRLLLLYHIEQATHLHLVRHTPHEIGIGETTLYVLISAQAIYHVQLLGPQITAVISGTVVYGAVSLFKKYLSPHLQPPDTTVYEDDRDALTAQFDAAEALLKEIQTETSEVKQAVQEQKEKVDKATKDVEAVVSEMREAEFRARDEMREVRDEINTIRDMLPKMIEKNKDAQTQSLAELQQELKSLKALLLSRGPTSSASSSVPMVGRPSIPAWQLAGSNSSNSPGATTFNTPSLPIPSPSATATTNGKGKEREVSEISPSS